jgi:hypothetical protein
VFPKPDALVPLREGLLHAWVTSLERLRLLRRRG